MERIYKKRLVPVARVDNEQDGLKLAEAIHQGGLDILEITLRTEAAFDALKAVRKAFPKMLLGAGTIIRPDQVDKAVDLGLDFGVAPGLNPRVVSRAIEQNLPFVPGIVSATDIEIALELGCKLLKFFPAEPAGGVALLKAIAAPYAHTGVKFIPLGGLNPLNMKKYLFLSSVAAIGGSWLADVQQMASGNWGAISASTSEALALIEQG